MLIPIGNFLFIDAIVMKDLKQTAFFQSLVDVSVFDVVVYFLGNLDSFFVGYFREKGIDSFTIVEKEGEQFGYDRQRGLREQGVFHQFRMGRVVGWGIIVNDVITEGDIAINVEDSSFRE